MKQKFHKELKCLIIHPEDEDSDILLAQLNRIGCSSTLSWPEPVHIPGDLDAVFFYLDHENPINYEIFDDERKYALIAMLGHTHPEILEALINANVQGIITKPIRSFSVFAHLLNARSIHQYEQRLNERIKKLDGNLKSRRKIEKHRK